MVFVDLITQLATVAICNYIKFFSLGIEAIDYSCTSTVRYLWDMFYQQNIYYFYVQHEYYPYKY